MPLALLHWWREDRQAEQHKQSAGAELVKKTPEAKAACEKVEALRRSAIGSAETASSSTPVRQRFFPVRS